MSHKEKARELAEAWHCRYCDVEGQDPRLKCRGDVEDAAREIEAALDEAAQESRDLLLSFIASLTLCDHMGDVCDDVDEVLKRLGEQEDWDEWVDLQRNLAKKGVKTLWGTPLGGNDDE